MNIDKQQIEQSLLIVYQKNLQYLKMNFFDIFMEIEQLSRDLESGKEKEKYSLEMKNGYFDILNLENEGYFYATNSYKDAEQRANKASFCTNNSLNLLRSDRYTNKLINGELYKDVAPIISYLNEKVDFDAVEFKKIYKKVYIGTGLGLHIQEIDKKIASYTTLIIEEELEIFRLSLFVTDYTVFNEDNRKLFLSVGVDIEKRKQEVHLFAEYHKYMNYNIKYNILLQDYYHIKDEIIEYFDENYVGSFPYKAMLENLKKQIGFIKNEDRFLNAFKAKERNILKDKKVLLISAGPSVDSYIDWIKDNQDKFIIVSVDIAVKKLELHNIVPDIVFSIDAHTIITKFLTTTNKDFLNDTMFILLSQQCSETMELLKNKNYYFSQVINLVKEIGYFGSIPNVGTFSFMVSIFLGANELYLIGNDAAFDQKTGSRYTQNSGADKSINILTDKIENVKNHDSNIINRDDIMEVKGNLRDIVKTNRELYRFKLNYEGIMPSLSEYSFDAYNLSDGVYINNLEPLTKKELTKKIANYHENKNDLKLKFDSISQVLEQLEVEDDIKIVNTIISRVKKFQKIKMRTNEDFLTQKLDLMIWILKKTKDMNYTFYGELFLQYTELVDIYVNFFLNLKQKNLDSKESLNKLSKMWAKGIAELYREIKECLK